MVRDEMKEGKVFEGFLDKQAVKTAQKLRKEGFYDEAGAPIKEGKESILLLAFHDAEPRLIKVHRVETSRFRHMEEYLRGDERFREDDMGNRREIIYSWTRKEFSNLKRCREAGVRCPEPLAFKDNMLVLEFIGEEGPAPLIREVELDDPEAVLDQLVEQYRLMYHEAGIVHADFSDFNILYWEGEPWIIDFAQGVVHSHPKAEDFLERDMENLAQFARDNGIDTDAEEMESRVKS